MKQQQDLDNSFIAEALPAFISEAQEQLEMLEQLLLQLEDAPQDSELLGALFRCAHTVKGSAGIFGLDEVVASPITSRRCSTGCAKAASR